MFRRVAGRPVLPCMDRAAQRRRTMSRCQRRIVSGVTGSGSPWRRALGITPSRAASRVRSAQFSFGRRGCRRCRTASWWRRSRISAVFHASSRRDSCSHAATRVIRRKTKRRHMIGDHYGPAGGRATLLVRAVDAILGTHSTEAARSSRRSHLTALLQSAKARFTRIRLISITGLLTIRSGGLFSISRATVLSARPSTTPHTEVYSKLFPSKIDNSRIRRSGRQARSRKGGF